MADIMVVADIIAVTEEVAAAAATEEAVVTVAAIAEVEVDSINPPSSVIKFSNSNFQILDKCYSQKGRNTGKRRKAASARPPSVVLPSLLVLSV
jgi:hypothetical protein